MWKKNEKKSKLKTAIYLWYRVYLNLNYVHQMFSNPEREYVKTNLTCLFFGYIMTLVKFLLAYDY
jgi:hypothetical protein